MGRWKEVRTHEEGCIQNTYVFFPTCANATQKFSAKKERRKEGGAGQDAFIEKGQRL